MSVWDYSPLAQLRRETFIISYPSDTDGGKADVLQERHLYHSHGLNRDIHVSQCLRAQRVPKGNLPFFFRLFVYSWYSSAACRVWFVYRIH